MEKNIQKYREQADSDSEEGRRKQRLVSELEKRLAQAAGKLTTSLSLSLSQSLTFDRTLVLGLSSRSLSLACRDALSLNKKDILSRFRTQEEFEKSSLIQHLTRKKVTVLHCEKKEEDDSGLSASVCACTRTSICKCYCVRYPACSASGLPGARCVSLETDIGFFFYFFGSLNVIYSDYLFYMNWL